MGPKFSFQNMEPCAREAEAGLSHTLSQMRWTVLLGITPEIAYSLKREGRGRLKEHHSLGTVGLREKPVVSVLIFLIYSIKKQKQGN